MKRNNIPLRLVLAASALLLAGVAAGPGRGVQPDEPVYEPRAQQACGEPAATLDDEPGQAALVEVAELHAEIDPPGGVGSGRDDDHPGIAERFPARLIGRVERQHP